MTWTNRMTPNGPQAGFARDGRLSHAAGEPPIWRGGSNDR